MYDVTVIIPTFREEANIRNIIIEVDAILKKNAINGEILVVDDNSPDRTIEIVNGLKRSVPCLNLIVRKEDPGLSQSVVEGFRHADSDTFLVMDADLSHPPGLIPQMLTEILAGNDIVIGSRYMQGGGIKQWPLKRRVISIGATFLGRLLFPDVSDPVSGFFAVKKSVVEEAPLKPRGYKILLEVMGKGTWKKDKEVPFEFVDREIGTSKLKVRTIVEYAQQVIDIAVFSWGHHDSAAWQEWKRVFKFGIVGISGIVVNLGILYLLVQYAQYNDLLASFLATEAAILSNFIWNDLWTFGAISNCELASRWQRLVAFNFVSAGGVVINLAIFYGLTRGFGIYYILAQFIGILVAFAWNFLINRRITWTRG